MNGEPDDPGSDAGPMTERPLPEAPPPEQTPGRWMLGCLGKALLVFVVVALLVFGACFLMLTGL